MFGRCMWEYRACIVNKLKRRTSETDKQSGEAIMEKKDYVDYKIYNEAVLSSFIKPNEGDLAVLVGTESNDNAYIEPFIEVDSNRIRVLTYLEKWFHEKKYGVILLYGEPRCGKSMLCKKATVEFLRGNLLKNNAKNVLSMSLNSGLDTSVKEKDILKIRNDLVWESCKELPSFYEDCLDSLLFLDDFDEFMDTAKDPNEKKVIEFMKDMDIFAKKYSVHVVVLSRTTAIKEYLGNAAISSRSFQLLPLTEDQQNNWLDYHTEYDDYREIFKIVRKYMNPLLEIPLFFRLIVHIRFKSISYSIAELYDNLFTLIMNRRNISSNRISIVKNSLMNLAYKIYCNDTKFAFIKEEEWDNDWLFGFYIMISKNQEGSLQRNYKVSYYHRTFYHFFLAKYIFHFLVDVTNKNAEEFIEYFAERELDYEVRLFLHYMLRESDKETIYSKMDIVFDTLVKTEAYCKSVPKNINGDAEKSKVGRSMNIFRNVLHIASAFSYVIQIPFKGNLDILCRTYNNDYIKIYSNKTRSANLIGANLTGADLRGADMTCANLSKVNLHGANLNGAELLATNLREANLSGANLNKAKLYDSDLSGADLSGVYLSGADLGRVNLSTAELSGINLNGASMCSANLNRANLSGSNMIKTDLTGADLREANLSETSMREANLDEANLFKADLYRADLYRASLIGADLRETDLSEANLSDAFLDGAYLRGADLEKPI